MKEMDCKDKFVYDEWIDPVNDSLYFAQVLTEFHDKMLSEMKQPDPEAEKILEDNLWNLV